MYRFAGTQQMNGMNPSQLNPGVATTTANHHPSLELSNQGTVNSNTSTQAESLYEKLRPSFVNATSNTIRNKLAALTSLDSNVPGFIRPKLIIPKDTSHFLSQYRPESTRNMKTPSHLSSLPSLGAMHMYGLGNSETARTQTGYTSNDVQASSLYSTANDFVNTLNINNNGDRHRIGNANDADTNTHNHGSNVNTDVDSGDDTILDHMSVIVEEETSDIDQLKTREVGR